ncbi:MAG: hypothetical protein JW857_08220 [Bacteroidales bacterium]|nr:hypothetical protein [Bacteroidales bacterium]
MKKIVVLFVFILFGELTATAQLFRKIHSLNDSSEHNLAFRIESTSFIKNNEYFNDFSKGYTGIGFFIKPSIEYYFTKNTKAIAGVYLLKYSGIDDFTQAIPLFSIQHKLNKNLEMIFGSLYGSLNHQLEESLYCFDRYYQDNVEYGLQFLYNSAKIKSDLWLNWEEFIFTNSPYQEELVFGNTTNITVYQSKKIQVNLPIQLLIAHKGGQIDASPDPVSSIVNGMSGLKINYQLGSFKTLSFEPLFFIYEGMTLPESGINSQSFKSGNAIYLKGHYNSKNLHAMLGYWKANKFIAPRGEYLFQSVSDWNPDFSQEERELITAKLEFNKQISNSINLVLKADAYYDMQNQDFAHALSLYLIIDESFFISKINARK